MDAAGIEENPGQRSTSVRCTRAGGEAPSPRLLGEPGSGVSLRRKAAKWGMLRGSWGVQGAATTATGRVGREGVGTLEGERA